MSCDKCRWFNKNGFALGTGECVLHKRVCGSGHNVCVHYEEYRPHGEWETKTIINKRTGEKEGEMNDQNIL